MLFVVFGEINIKIWLKRLNKFKTIDNRLKSKITINVVNLIIRSTIGQN